MSVSRWPDAKRPRLAHWKTGRHSKVLRGIGLGAKSETALADPELGELRREIALVDVRIQNLIEAKDWDKAVELVGQRRKSTA